MDRADVVRRVSNCLCELAKERSDELGLFEASFLWKAAQSGEPEEKRDGLAYALHYVLKLSVLKRRKGFVPPIVASRAFIARFSKASTQIWQGNALVFDRATRHMSDAERRVCLKNGLFNYSQTVAAEKATTERLLR